MLFQVVIVKKSLINKTIFLFHCSDYSFITKCVLLIVFVTILLNHTSTYLSFVFFERFFVVEDIILHTTKGLVTRYCKINDKYVIVYFLSQVIFVFLLFLDMLMYANEVETKET